MRGVQLKSRFSFEISFIRATVVLDSNTISLKTTSHDNNAVGNPGRNVAWFVKRRGGDGKLFQTRNSRTSMKVEKLTTCRGPFVGLVCPGHALVGLFLAKHRYHVLDRVLPRALRGFSLGLGRGGPTLLLRRAARFAATATYCSGSLA